MQNRKFVISLWCVLTFGTLSAQAGQWDDLRNQWREEYKQVRELDIPVLENQAGNGDMRAIYMLSILQQEKRYAQNNAGLASRLQQWMCSAGEAGHAVMTFGCGLGYQLGEGVAKDDAKSVAWIRKAAESGYGRAMWYFGVINEVGQNGLPKDAEQAVKWYRKAAEAGVKEAMFNLGLVYQNGIGVTKDEVQAVAWYRKGAEASSIEAMNSLGTMYQHGNGVTKDEAQAVAWYRKSAEGGNAVAMSNLGWVYANGAGVVKDVVQAVAWYRKAAEQGDASGQTGMGLMYEYGTGVAQSDTEAVAWYRKAAAQGDGYGQSNLGTMYLYGKGGLPRSNVVAYALYHHVAPPPTLVSSVGKAVATIASAFVGINLAGGTQANQSAASLADSNRDFVSAQMTSEEIARAKALAKEFDPPGNLLNAIDNYLKRRTG